MPSHQPKTQRPVTTSPPTQAPPTVKAGTQGGGQALDRHTQNQMSARFGHNFSQIRIHTDARAGESAAAMGANAYALGSDIVFGSGKYNPGSRETDRLLAHELTHVAQQSQFGGGDWGRTSRKGDASEREADSVASQIMMGHSVQVRAAPGAAVARDEFTEDTPAALSFGSNVDNVPNSFGYNPAPGDPAPRPPLPNDPSALPSVPDGRGNKTTTDALDTIGDAAESLPFVGNLLSVGGALGGLGVAGYDALTGDKRGEQTALNGAEDNALNAIPGFGNLRAAGQAGHDASTTVNDFDPSISPQANPSAEDNFDLNGGAQALNKSLGDAYDQALP